MNKNIAFNMAAALVLAGVASCNSSSSDYYTELDGNAMVKSFSLASNDKVLANLDSVYFSIDLVSGKIFNADSLPVETKTSALIANIITDNASAVTLYVPRPGQEDSTINYLEHSSDSINFANGPVGIEVVSQNGTTKKMYRVQVNVHTMVSDSLCWGDRAFAALPAAMSTPTAQRTVKSGNTFYTFVTDGSSYSVAASNDFASWDPEAFNPGFAMDVNSICHGSMGFCALDADGLVHTANSPKGPWTAGSGHYSAFYGVHQGTVVGVRKNADGSYAIDTYPSVNTVIDMPAGMPVEGFSPGIELTSEMSAASQLLITGGRRADGSLSGDTYGFDGMQWAKISVTSLPKVMEGVAVAPYYSMKNRKIAWRADALPTLLAIGGRNTQGEISRVIYMSRDWGMHWAKADSLLQPPTELPAVYGAQAIVANRTLTSRSAATWTELGGTRLPLGARIESLDAQSRATSPVTEWEAPYIYLFGGYDDNDRLNTTVWRGAINRLTYKPLE